jgi:hypothetical protein
MKKYYVPQTKGKTTKTALIAGTAVLGGIYGYMKFDVKTEVSQVNQVVMTQNVQSDVTSNVTQDKRVTMNSYKTKHSSSSSNVAFNDVMRYISKVAPRTIDSSMDYETIRLYLMLSESGMVYDKRCGIKSKKSDKTLSPAYGVVQFMPRTNRALDERLNIPKSKTWSVPAQDRKFDALMDEYIATLKKNGLPVNLLNIKALHVFGATSGLKVIRGESVSGNLYELITSQMRVRDTFATSLPRATQKWLVTTAITLDKYREIAEGTGTIGVWKGVKKRVRYAFFKAKKKAGLMRKRLVIKRAYNTPEENRRRGGVEKSQHINGLAIDIDVTSLTEKERQTFIKELINHGFKGIGVGPTTIHADMRPTKKGNRHIARWSYFKDKSNNPFYPKWANDVFVAMAD